MRMSYPFQPGTLRSKIEGSMNGGVMRAAVGDRLHFQGKVVGLAEHTAVVIEARGENGTPPYVVRYENGHETVVFPGADVWIEHRDESPSKG